MDITFISDTHSHHELMTQDLSGGPILVHCGDVSNRGRESEVIEFLEWFHSLPYTHKIFIAGNHDFIFQKTNNIVIPDGIHYLFDSSVIIEGIKFYGTPWQPWFYDWAFNLPVGGNALREKWAAIPNNTDIVIVHGPPFGILDTVARGGVHVGCRLLAERLLEIKPNICAFGHIHEAFGTTTVDKTTYINASMLDLRYEYTNKPMIIKYETTFS